MFQFCPGFVLPLDCQETGFICSWEWKHIELLMVVSRSWFSSPETLLGYSLCSVGGFFKVFAPHPALLHSCHGGHGTLWDTFCPLRTVTWDTGCRWGHVATKMELIHAQFLFLWLWTRAHSSYLSYHLCHVADKDTQRFWWDYSKWFKSQLHNNKENPQ